MIHYWHFTKSDGLRQGRKTGKEKIGIFSFFPKRDLSRGRTLAGILNLRHGIGGQGWEQWVD
jgi:hypothetical protein